MGCTALAGGCLGIGLGIQNSLDHIAKQDTNLSAEVREYLYNYNMESLTSTVDPW
jgi:hypothetical protein